MRPTQEWSLEVWGLEEKLEASLGSPNSRLMMSRDTLGDGGSLVELGEAGSGLVPWQASVSTCRLCPASPAGQGRWVCVV